MRDDLSDYLVHWTKGENDAEAFEVLCKIVFDEHLIGGTGFIKGKHRCICFTETPVYEFHKVLGKYKQFGIMISKENIFRIGGRPVIYQTNDEYWDLPEKMRWRHVGYDPTGFQSNYQDFTWEREWRLFDNQLSLSEDETWIVVPNQYAATEIEKRWYQKEWGLHQSYNNDFGYQYEPRPFPYNIFLLYYEE